MANRKKENELLFEQSEMAERLTDLRKNKHLTLGQLETNIMEKTGVSISAQQLSMYEKDIPSLRPNINNLLAISEYYNVSLDYLLCRSNSKNDSATDKHTANKFGLSDKSMELLHAIKQGHSMFEWKNELINIGNTTLSSKLINFIFENDNFWSGFDSLLSNYIQVKNTLKKDNPEDNVLVTNELKKVHPSVVKDVGAARYSLIMLFEDLLDEIYDSFPQPATTKKFFKIADKKGQSSH